MVSYQTVANFKFTKHFPRESIEFSLKYEPKNSDKFVVTYPKCGTTWTQHIINLINNNGCVDENNLTFVRSSFLEFSGEAMNSDTVIKTHLPYELLPFNSCAKYLLVFRNPKDCCVSYYYHTLKIDPEFKGDFHEFFQHWIRGDVPYGDYFQHTVNYWSIRFENNFEFLVYEDMKNKPRDAVFKIAKFIGLEAVNKLVKNERLIEEVLKKSSIDSMRKDLYIYDFVIRKGIVGDWKHHFTKDESDLVDQRVDNVFGGTGLEILWERHMKWHI